MFLKLILWVEFSGRLSGISSQHVIEGNMASIVYFVARRPPIEHPFERFGQ